MGEDSLVTGLAEDLGFFGMGEEVDEVLGHLIGVEGVDKVTGFLVLDNFWGATEYGADNRFLASHGFEDNSGERIEVDGGDQDNVAGVVGGLDLVGREPAGEGEGIEEVKCFGKVEEVAGG